MSCKLSTATQKFFQIKNPALLTFPTVCTVVSSAVSHFTSEFGMGSGGTMSLEARSNLTKLLW